MNKNKTDITPHSNNEYIGFGIPSMRIYNIQPSNFFPVVIEEYSINDSRPTSLEIIDKHLVRYQKVWKALF